MDKERNYGIDFLRIVAVFMIVVLHCFTAGGLWDATIRGSSEDKISVFLVVLCYSGVDIFALISGYVSFFSEGKSFDFSRYLELWFEVVFYGVLLNIIFSIVKPELLVWDNYLSVILPVSSGAYWYFCAFTGLYMMKPIVDCGLKSINESTMKKFFCVFIVLFCFVSIYSNAFVFNKGYTAFWLIVLYIIGYGINKFKLFNNVKTYILILTIFIMLILTICSYYVIHDGRFIMFDIYSDIFISYVSPTIVIISVCMVILFSRFRFKKLLNRGIGILAPTAFSVYLVDCHPMFWELIVKNSFSDLNDKGAWNIIKSVFSFSVPLLLFVIIFDLLRIRFFKLLKIDILADKIEIFLRKGIDRLASLL